MLQCTVRGTLLIAPSTAKASTFSGAFRHGWRRSGRCHTVELWASSTCDCRWPSCALQFTVYVGAGGSFSPSPTTQELPSPCFPRLSSFCSHFLLVVLSSLLSMPGLQTIWSSLPIIRSQSSARPAFSDFSFPLLLLVWLWLYVAASVTGSTGSAAYTWPTLTKIKTQQEYIRISYVLLLIKNPARAIRPHNGNSSIHQVPTLSIFLALFYPYACNGPPSGLETVLSETCWLSFSTTFFDISRWNGRGIVCLPSRIPVFLKKKKKSQSSRKIGAVGDDKQLIFFYSALYGKNVRKFSVRKFSQTESKPLHTPSKFCP